MESVEVRQALETAIMLGEVSERSHTVEINRIGKVRINGGSAALMTNAGKWEKITRDNLELRFKELMTESVHERIKRKMKTLVYS